jgi:hypothetical protein
VKVRIAIEGCDAHAKRIESQLDTWASDPIVRVMTGPMLGVPDDYEHLPEKTKAICEWALIVKADFIFKVDTDTYVHIQRLLASGFEQWDYSGYVLDSLPVAPYCSGPHYWLSRKAFTILANEDWSKYKASGYETCEDVMVGTILKAHGILPHHDHRYSPFTPVLPDNDIISQHLSGHTAYKAGQMEIAHRNATLQNR